MVDRLLAFGTRARERVGYSFLSTIEIGWAGGSFAYFGTRWDARVDSEDALLAHFLGWFLTAYSIGAGVGLSLVRGCGIGRLYLTVVGWILFGALIGGFLLVETALAGASIGLHGSGSVQLLLLLGGTLPWMMPLITGSIAFSAALKFVAARMAAEAKILMRYRKVNSRKSRPRFTAAIGPKSGWPDASARS